ncbi:DUF421 domain-containing protein [Candidatus Nitrosocosmicus arcticus]|uniref:YetF C-terminal domain-containing protein n=1 Tax=Candidatus Nitrosocosmicus arcticus TaxID=2035267 RepID=A0A557SUV5_9ARCH|nr:YetF domain-containing protein [Candidatus Nitrosocosmicus arcticus]TVP40387.1 membrane protein of unknown function [Candidatus Nitrosocosmicus arcticus]
MINNSTIWIIIIISLAIMLVVVGYLVYQVNSISVTLNAVLEQNSNNNGTNDNGISEQLALLNALPTTPSESSDSETGIGPPNEPAESFPYDLIYSAIVPDPSVILSVIIRTAIIASLVFIIVKWLGGKGIGQLSPFALLIVVGLGSAIGDPMLYKEISIPQAMAAVIIAIIFFKAIDYLTLKSRRFRNSLQPKPILLVDYGSIIKEGLKKAKMDITEFEAEMRLEGIENEKEIKYARLESNGRISFIMKEK